jgi:hypothetical protein
MLVPDVSGKARARRDGLARPAAAWRLLFLSSGEIGLADHMREGGKRARPGQEVRLADLPADAGAGCGVFEELHGHGDGAELAGTLLDATRAIMGHLGAPKEMQLPAGAPQQLKPDNTLVKALARAFRWKRMLESGEFVTIGGLAERENIAPSYMTRVLRLTLLAPDIIEAILDGWQRAGVSLAQFLEPFPAEWASQRLWP